MPVPAAAGKAAAGMAAAVERMIAVRYRIVRRLWRHVNGLIGGSGGRH